MGTLITAFKTLLGGDPLDGIKGIINSVKLDPTVKAQLEQQLELAKINEDEITQARDEALDQLKANIITAETQSKDPYVSRAHATFLYIMEIAIGINLIIFPLISLIIHNKLILLDIPTPYLELFGTAYLGYVGGYHATDIVNAWKGNQTNKS